MKEGIWDAYTHHPDIEEAHEVYKRCEALLHAMQSGIAMAMNQPGSKETDPKHLRVGVNNAMIENSALQMLLVAKGIISPLEYAEAVEVLLKTEIERYRQEIAEQLGTSSDRVHLK